MRGKQNPEVISEGTTVCHVSASVAWEPHLSPFSRLHHGEIISEFLSRGSIMKTVSRLSEFTFKSHCLAPWLCDLSYATSVDPFLIFKIEMISLLL